MMKKLALIICIALGFHATAQTAQKPQKLVLTNVKNGVVYYDEQPDYKSEKVYTVELHFSNPIAKIEKKEPIALTLDNKPNNRFALVNYEIPSYHNDRYWWNKRDIILDTAIAITYWDSTHQVKDINDPGVFIAAPVIQYFRIDWVAEEFGISELKLHIPFGTFTDIYGNKNEEINVTYKKRKK